MRMLNFMELQKEIDKHYTETPEYSSLDFLCDLVEWLNDRPDGLSENVNVFGLLKEYLEVLDNDD